MYIFILGSKIIMAIVLYTAISQKNGFAKEREHRTHPLSMISWQ